MNEENNQPENYQPDAQEMPRAEFAPPKPETNSSFSTLLISVTALLILGGVAFGAFYAIKSSNKGDLSREEVIVNSLVAYMEADSISSTTNIEVTGGDSLELRAQLDASVQTADNFSDTLMSLNLDAYSLFQDGGLSLEFVADAEMRLIDGIFYYYITKAPDIPFFELSALEGTWMSFNPEREIENYTIDGIDYREDAIDMVRTYGVNMLKFAQEEGFITISSLRDQRIEGVSTYVYQIDISLKSLPDFLISFADRYLKGEHAETIREAGENMKRTGWTDFEITTNGDDFIIPITVSISKNDLQLKQISSRFSFSTKDEMLPGGDISHVEIFLSNTFHGINEAINVETPSNSRPIEEVIEGLFGVTWEDPETHLDSDSSIKASMSQARIDAEFFYHVSENYSGMCSTSDIISKAIESSPASGPVSDFCNDSDTHWVASVPL